MFTGIVESIARVEGIRKEGTNRHFQLSAVLDEAIQVDQSIAHDGVCLTVTRIEQNEPNVGARYEVTAVEETLEKTALGEWEEGRKVNLERCVRVNQRMDGHFVQGHVDTRGQVSAVEDRDGSFNLKVGFPAEFAALVVPKGSICIQGVSLTVVDCGQDWLSVTLIPYTWEHTNLHQLEVGAPVNLEFDILGKYLLRSLELKGEV